MWWLYTVKVTDVKVKLLMGGKITRKAGGWDIVNFTPVSFWRMMVQHSPGTESTLCRGLAGGLRSWKSIKNGYTMIGSIYQKNYYVEIFTRSE